MIFSRAAAIAEGSGGGPSEMRADRVLVRLSGITSIIEAKTLGLLRCDNWVSTDCLVLGGSCKLDVPEIESSW